jgi:hypothetical protein
MGELMVKVRVAPGREIELPLPQLMSVGEVIGEFADPVWHWADCKCCIVVHESGEHIVGGYIVGPDGGRDWIAHEH